MEKNKLIAEFMGAIYHPPVEWWDFQTKWSDCYVFDGKIGFSDCHLKYHTSWDWLIPVVQKIKQVSTKKETNKINYDLYVKGLSVFGLSVGAGIENIYNAVIEFIEWHNSQKS